MDKMSLDPGVFLFPWMGKTFRLAFFGNASFRLYEEGRGGSDVVTFFFAKKDATMQKMEEGIYFNRKELSVLLSNSGTITVKWRDKVVLSGDYHVQDHGANHYSLAEKEGHDGSSLKGLWNVLRIQNDGPVYGLGERTGPLDKRGYDYIDWNTDDPAAHVDTFKSLYQSVPFFLLFRKRQSVGVFFDNTSKLHFDINKADSSSVLVEYEKGFFDAYFFFGTMPDIIASYTSLTGRQPLVPLWALGAQQCRWSYPNKEKVEAVIEGYRKADIPLSTVYLDIDYMDSYMDFTIDESKFPDIQNWLEELKQKDIHIVPIIDAGVKAKEGYRVYDTGIGNGYFCTLNGEVYHNEVWPGDSVFPAFLKERVQKWWALHIKKMLELGFDGIWNDMNEPASFKGPLPLEVKMGKGVSHEMAHNVYGHYMCKAGAEGFKLAKKRLFQLTRAGYSGTCQYSGSWAGDNQSIYDHLRLMIPQLLNMSLSGQSYVGVDIGGFGGDTTPELLVKWAVASILNPLYRNHSALGTKDQEPYTLEGDYLNAYRDAVLMRYELLPTLYVGLFSSESDGFPALRPLVYNYPYDERTYNENTALMWGEDLLLAPSLFPGQSKRHVYFPESFLHYPSLKEYPAGDHVIDCGIGDIPLFIRKNGMVLLAPKGNKEAKLHDTLRIYYGGGDTRCYYYEDKGDGLAYKNGDFNLYEFHGHEGRVFMSVLHHGIDEICTKVRIFNENGEEKEYPLKDLVEA